MAKTNKSVGRKKWIAGGIAAFAAVTLVTTGFATWIIGNQAQEQEGNINIAIDTAKNSAVTLAAEIAADESITIAEAPTEEEESNDIVTVEDGGLTPDMEFSFSTLQLTCGQAYAEENNISLNISIKYDATYELPDVTKANTFKGDAKHDLIGKRDDATDYHYVELSKTIQLTVGEKLTVQNDGTYQYNATGDDLKCTLTWGNYFGNKAPTDYYNDLFAAGSETGLSNDVATLQKVTKELQMMEESLNPEGIEEGQKPTLTILVSIDTKPKSN